METKFFVIVSDDGQRHYLDQFDAGEVLQDAAIFAESPVLFSVARAADDGSGADFVLTIGRGGHCVRPGADSEECTAAVVAAVSQS